MGFLAPIDPDYVWYDLDVSSPFVAQLSLKWNEGWKVFEMQTFIEMKDEKSLNKYIQCKPWNAETQQNQLDHWSDITWKKERWIREKGERDVG